jgi:hypothetical protein
MCIQIDENTLKIVARFTPLGAKWPNQVWVCIVYVVSGDSKESLGWYITEKNTHKRWPDELSELEANQKGYFRDKNRRDKCYTVFRE